MWAWLLNVNTVNSVNTVNIKMSCPLYGIIDTLGVAVFGFHRKHPAANLAQERELS